MGPLSTHVLDTSTGRPAVGLRAVLRRGDGTEVGSGTTDASGRIGDLANSAALSPGEYELVFATGAWFDERSVASLYPSVTIRFRWDEPGDALHLPLLLSPFGYSTYRGG